MIWSLSPENRMLVSSDAEAFSLWNFINEKSPYDTRLSLIPGPIHISQEQLNDSLVAAMKAA